MKKLTIIPIIFLLAFITSCNIEDIVEEVTKIDEPVKLEATMNETKIVCRLGGGTLRIYKDNSFSLFLYFWEADNYYEILEEEYSLITMNIYGLDINDLNNGVTFYENYNVKQLTESYSKNFLADFEVTNYSEIGYTLLDSDFLIDDTDGYFKITNFNSESKTVSANFSFTASGLDSDFIYIKNGKIFDLAYSIEYSNYESVNDEF